jgi:hypothetical protein
MAMVISTEVMAGILRSLVHVSRLLMSVLNSKVYQDLITLGLWI